MEKTSACFDLISHPDRTLQQHLTGCDVLSEKILSLKFVEKDTFFELSFLNELRKIVVYFHDFGKASFFQSKIIKATIEAENNQEFKNQEAIKEYLAFFNENRRAYFNQCLGENDRLSNHAKIGGYFAIEQIEHDDIFLKFVILKIIRRHHGYLTNFFYSNEETQIQLEQKDIQFLEKQIEVLDFESYNQILSNQSLITSKEHWEKIKSELSSGRKFVKYQTEFESKKEVKYFFLQHYLFSLLLSADKGDLMLLKTDKDWYIQENTLLPLNIINDYKTNLFSNDAPKPIDFVREEAYQLVQRNVLENSSKAFFSITLPTGLGKTFSAFNVATILQNAFYEQHGSKPRVIYVLPFTSIIDQNENIFRKILKSSNIENLETRLSKNHYLAMPNEQYDEEKLSKDEPEYLSDGWEHDFIVTTFVQFLEGIFTNKNRLLRKFHNMTNAIFILDEVQNIPPQYFEVIELVFKKMNEYFGTKFVFVTATQPFIFNNNDEILELANPKKYFENLERIEINQRLLTVSEKHLSVDEFCSFLIEDIKANIDKSFLIICNTIKSSQEIHKQLKQEFEEVLYLSSSILPFKRLEVIEKIKTQKGHQIVVSTQVVEAGVDIDLDIVYRDFAPIDSINQSAGRCNRNGLKGKGAVKLFDLGKSKYVYDKVLLSVSRDVLKNHDEIIQESTLYDLNLEYATQIRKRKVTDSNASQKLIDCIQNLQLEDIEKNFKLIEEDFRNYNVFLPVDDKSLKIWGEFMSIFKLTDDDFERKREIKKIKPSLLQYVTRFPKNKFVPSSEQQDKGIIYVADWQNYYDLETGFKLLDDKDFII
ncbi:CRISPR-associated helicase Cas3' [Arcicella sp. LKC2W]|uniref:CRISPR-associated helicase Cas3' n=1 Tax=Arcicella sp. LKC2W TaxID=2984198 RepID=UPI002B1F91A7|nr:CRISPR-associated helicase Cas3' [Arcicella sp. LKC2W]MEA5458744.1 CRISPR-associated helicase Cas3' [Arcicella sp. LKC2W]